MTRPRTCETIGTTYLTTRTSLVVGAKMFSISIVAASADDGDDRDRDLPGRRPGQQFQLDEDQPDERCVNAEQQDFHQATSLRPRARRQPRLDRCEVGSNGVELGRRDSAFFERGHALPDVSGWALGIREAVFFEVVGTLVGAVRQLVAHGLRVRPQPGQRPEQPSEDERQQAQGLDRLELRMMPLVRDLLRKHVHHPEEDDEDDRDEEDHEPGEKAGHGVFGRRGQERRFGRRGSGDRPGERDKTDGGGTHAVSRSCPGAHGTKCQRHRPT